MCHWVYQLFVQNWLEGPPGKSMMKLTLLMGFWVTLQTFLHGFYWRWEHGLQTGMSHIYVDSIMFVENYVYWAFLPSPVCSPAQDYVINTPSSKKGRIQWVAQDQTLVSLHSVLMCFVSYLMCTLKWMQKPASGLDWKASSGADLRWVLGKHWSRQELADQCPHPASHVSASVWRKHLHILHRTSELWLLWAVRGQNPPSVWSGMTACPPSPFFFLFLPFSPFSFSSSFPFFPEFFLFTPPEIIIISL